jgi:hypothetical protein
VEKQEASALVKDIPTYILSQHRYSIIFDQLTSGLDVDKIIKCNYNWGIERNTVSEYLYHIASLDSYLKNKNVEIYHNEYGEYIIDDISTVNISKQFQRRLKIQIETELYTGEFIITKAMNSMTMKSKRDKQQAYRVSGGVIVVHGKNTQDLQLTTEDKAAFQETMDEFLSEVSEFVDFYPLNIYASTVEWSGRIIDKDLEFFYSIGESNGVYINGTMIKVDYDFVKFIEQIQSYYQKFKTKWAKVLAVRKKTITIPEDE